MRLYAGKPLPADWAGKPYACYQIAQYARGDWFLFLDADTICESHMIKGTLEIAIKHRVALLSGFPRQKLTGLTQKIVLPVLFLFRSKWPGSRCGYFIVPEKPMPTMIIGQFILFNKDDYQQIGGHEAVKSRIMEDVWFGLEMSEQGGRTLAVDLSKPLQQRCTATWRS